MDATPGTPFEAEGFTIDEPPPETDEEAVARLAKLPPLEYERIRSAEAGRLGCRTAVLDRLVADSRGDNEGVKGRGVSLDDAEPWPHSVNLADLLNDTVAAIRRHVVLPGASADIVALWISHSHCFDRFDHTPRLGITSPLRRCGKSTLIDVLRLTCRRPLKADTISASAVFRVVEALKPLTLLIDEADSFLKDNEELRGVLNSGFERSGQAVRVVDQDGDLVPVAFATFAPCVLAAIGSLPSTLTDRAIPIQLQRKPVSEHVEKLRHARNREVLGEISSKFARWAADASYRLGNDPKVPDQLGDREGDIAIPLLSIADHAGGDWPGRARRGLLEVFGVRAADGDNLELGSLLLSDIRDLFAGRSSLQMFSADICNWLGAMEDRPWPEWRQGKVITPTQLARALAPFKIRPGTIRSGQETGKGYYRDAFQDAWTRYLATESPPSTETQNSEPSHRHSADPDYNFCESRPVTLEKCDGYENPKKPRHSAGCDGVTDQNPLRRMEKGVTGQGQVII